MTDEPPPETDRTIIRPKAPSAPPPDLSDRTRIEPAQMRAPSAPPPQAARGGNRQIAIGDVLNGLFEVKRFIARGGMGEVYEGVHVHDGERLAIKVILPHLADDQNVLDLFRNEALTLKKLQHPALVRYVTLGKEEQFGVFYIVTEYIDGANLSDVLAEIKPTPDELIGFTRRLAEGLQAAHALGAVHRDMAPDNVILQDGRIDRARIIDFGIAKDLNPGSRTIIGDGFGGKLGFVAPEQLGDFDRQVGPWSDVYSLGLLTLSVAQGRKVAMGDTFIDAMNIRRKGVDTSIAPPAIRGVLDRMLVADPAERLRSMSDVIAALAAPTTAPLAKKAEPKPKAAKPPKPVVAKPTPSSPGTAQPDAGRKRLMIGGGAAAALLVLAGGAYLAFGGSPDTPVAAPPVAAGGETAAPIADTVRTAVAAALPTLPCTWLDLTRVDAADGRVAMAFTGVAGRPAEAEAAISKVASGSGAAVGATDFADVAPIPATECPMIDAVRQIRANPATPHLSSAQRRYTLATMTSGIYEGQLGANAIIELNIGPQIRDFALYGLEPSGAISPVLPSRAIFDAAPKGPGTNISDLGNGRYRLQVEANHSGWSGLLLLTGNGGFSDELMVGQTGTRAADWQQRFAAAAAKGEWKSEMVWYNMVK